MPECVIGEYEPLLDSSNMMPDDWLKIAEDIAGHYAAFDGFVVLHGTDTMAYTASALAFMLDGLSKPVILTGSQIPLCELRNDARENLVATLLIAAQYPVPEVCLYFGGRLLRGCRATKVDAGGLDAFASPRFPALGLAGTRIEIAWDLVRRPAADTALTVQRFSPPVVGALRLFPGISAQVVRHALLPPLQGMVLEAYGVGNGPDRDGEFLAVLAEATGRGVVVVACTQCLRGMVNLTDYAAGTALARAGVISGGDMTAEAALAKLFYLFSRGDSPADAQRGMGANLRGELTPALNLPDKSPDCAPRATGRRRGARVSAG